MKHILLATLLAVPAIAGADPYLARCQMGECQFHDQGARQVVATGTDAVPGEMVMVSLRSATSQDPDADPASLDWGGPVPVQFFCSKVRPALLMDGGSYQGLDLVTPAGATEGVTTMYLQACHPEVSLSGDPFAVAADIGYKATPIDTAADFAALTQP